jgi:hypothetical protein
MGPHWRRDLTPCLYDRGTLLVAPADTADIFALDAQTGQMLWQTALEDATQLLGVAGESLIAAGGRLYWIGLAGPQRGRLQHVWPDGQEKPGYGRGLLAGGDVLWPTRENVYVVDARTAQVKKAIDLVSLGVRGGNLLVAGRRLLVADDRGLVALGPRAKNAKADAAELTTTRNH